jgi:hypothetical protein
MGNLLLWIGRLSGSAGVVVCAAALVTRLAGTWMLGGLAVGTIFLAGMAAMILGCLAYCADMAERARSRASTP